MVCNIILIALTIFNVKGMCLKLHVCFSKVLLFGLVNSQLQCSVMEQLVKSFSDPSVRNIYLLKTAMHPGKLLSSSCQTD